jgi:hypothetical protein
VLGNALIYAVQQALTAAEAYLGIHSPSTLFETRIGENITGGMATGVMGAAPQLQAAVAGVSGLSTAPLSGFRSGNATTSTTTQSVTIAPGAIVIQQQPGQSSRQLAEEVMNEIMQLMDARLA